MTEYEITATIYFKMTADTYDDAVEEVVKRCKKTLDEVEWVVVPTKENKKK